MGGINKGLGGEQGQRLGLDLDDVPAFELALSDKVAGQLAVWRVVYAERKQLVI